MAAKDRSRDDKRSVGSHEKMMGALGKAAGWTKASDKTGGWAVQDESRGSGIFEPGRPYVRYHDSK